MKKLLRCAAVILCLLLVVPLTACSEKGLTALSKSLTTYKIDVQFSDTDKTLTATQEVDYYNDSDIELGEVWFNLYPNAYREGATVSPIDPKEFSVAYPNGISYGSITVNSVTIKDAAAEFSIVGEDSNALCVKLPKSLMPSARVKISMNYTVKIPNMRHRFGYLNKTVNLGNFYPVACVYENGEFNATPYYANGDPFYFKSSNFIVTITAPKKYTVAASGSVLRTENGENAVTTSTILAARDFAAVLGEFTTSSQNVTLPNSKSVAVNYYYYSDTTPEDSLKAACDAITTFSNQFMDYPYESLSVVQTSFNQGGMEYSSLVYVSDLLSGEIYKEVIIHETAHQWWYGIVGNSQISDAWMDEALTEFSTSVFYELNPHYNVNYSERIADAMSGYKLFIELSGKDTDTSMNRKVNEYKSSTEYTYMTYVKGQLMMDAVRKSIGDKALFSGLKDYCNANAYKVARPDNLIASLEKASGVNLKSFFESWLTGSVLLYGGIR